MNRARLAGGMLLVTLAAVVVMALSGNGGEEATPARITTVTRGDVVNITALMGRVGYQDERILFATAPGMVLETCVEPGQRVAAGDALIRMDASVTERLAAAWASQKESDTSLEDMQALVQGTVLRAPENATVRQVLVAGHAPVALGDPVIVLSGAKQLIRCMAVERDASRIAVGMKAILSVDGEEIGRGEITEIGSAEADPDTGRTFCNVTLLPEDHIGLPGGASVDVDVVMSGAWDVPALPVEAITERGTVWRVYEGICTEIPVEIVLSDEMRAWVNLPEGLQVAIGEFTEGQRVAEVNP